MRYDFKAEAVHWRSMNSAEHHSFRCIRCHRIMPEEKFAPLFRASCNIRKLAPNMGRPVPLHPKCHTCREQERGEHAGHPMYTPAIDRFFAGLTTSAASGAKSRGILFGLEKDDVLGMYLDQEGCCALSGIRLDFKETGSFGRSRKAPRRPSIDRINSEGNYVLGNVQIVASVVNIMKTELPQDVFIELCGKIAENAMLSGLTG
jgi:hypothetical protein